MNAAAMYGDASTLGSLGGYRLRAVGGLADDLTIDVAGLPGVDAVTRLLAACLTDDSGRPATVADIRAAPVGDRVAAVMALAAIIDEGPLTLELRCPGAGCGEAIEIAVDWAEVAQVARRAARAPIDVHAGRTRYLFRRATGLDQERWAMARPTPTAREVLASLMVEGTADRLTPARMATIEAALDDADPLVCFGIDVRCPSCGAAYRHEPSLVRAAAAIFARAQRALLDDVHELARAYGWTEAEILAIPAWRRARYRARLAGVA